MSLIIDPIPLVSLLIKRISDLQSTGNTHFQAGLFPSERLNSSFYYKRPDSNIFGTASTLFILQELKAHLSLENQQQIEAITHIATRIFPKYKNKDGLATYNFWQTKPSHHFPFGKLMHRFKHFKLPDDIDDTSLAYKVMGYKKEEMAWLKEKLCLHAGQNKVYSTWFGEKMPIEQDVCALCNLMYLVFDANEKLNEFDKKTLLHLNKIIVSGDYLTKTFWVSRHYATVPLIVYHYARLLSQFEVHDLAMAKEKLIEKLPSLFDNEKQRMNKILLQTAWLKLKGEKSNLEIENWEMGCLELDLKSKTKNFYSFIGAPFAPFNSGLFRFFAQQKIFQIGWKCEAHEYALLLENNILRNYSSD